MDAANGDTPVVEAQGLGKVSIPKSEWHAAKGNQGEIATQLGGLQISETKPESGPVVEAWLENSAYHGERSQDYVRIEVQDAAVAFSDQNQSLVASSEQEARPV
ncbi:hypothetical protein [uncultured Shimia sp.]|uniref:hypothetical protein n=1 Tax=uncultured Shimia sp. TaxID=573152 RepID=UPI00262E8F76|nr:hypothetical protein [uncultured Shimia sp.]